jgi:hypothetical protein
LTPELLFGLPADKQVRVEPPAPLRRAASKGIDGDV